MLHPLLLKIDILNTTNIDTACKKIEDLGLLTKKHDNLIIVKYPSELKYSSEDYIRQSRGIIIDFNNKKIVCSSIPGGCSLDHFRESVDNFDDIVIEKCLDGTLINLYYYNDRWNVSTKFNINADESKFRSNKSYRELLDEIINIDNLGLDSSYTYSLLLRHTESRNVTPIRRNRVIHVETTNNTTGEKIKVDIGLKTPGIIKFRHIVNKYNFTSYEDILDNLKQKTWKCPGYIIYSQDRKYHVRLENPNYVIVENMVKNQNNTEYIVLDHLLNGNIHTLLGYYPEWNEIALYVNNVLNDYIDKVYQIYVENKIKKTALIIDKKYRKAVYNIHEIYLNSKNNGSNISVTYGDVCKTIRNYDTAYLFSILLKK